MRIISKYKDYYDYLKGIYGEDPLTVYVRDGIPLSDNGNFHMTFVSEGLYYFRVPDKHHGSETSWWSKWHDKKGILHDRYYGALLGFELVIGNAMIYFEIDRYKENGEIVNDMKYHIYDVLPHARESKEAIYIAWNDPKSSHSGIMNSSFGVESKHDTIVEDPILRDTFLCSIVDPQLIWDRVAEYIGLQKNVETRELTDKEKIAQYGFDNKTSFRNIK